MFDLTVHRKDSKGNVVDYTPYRMMVVNGNRRFERPLGSGFWYSEGGELIEQPQTAPAEEAAPVVEAAVKSKRG